MYGRLRGWVHYWVCKLALVILAHVHYMGYLGL
jgi:hypothetical protein